MREPGRRDEGSGARVSIAALMGLIALTAVVARWPAMVFPAAVLLGIGADRLRLSFPQAVLLMLLLGAALGIALAVNLPRAYPAS